MRRKWPKMGILIPHMAWSGGFMASQLPWIRVLDAMHIQPRHFRVGAEREWRHRCWEGTELTGRAGTDPQRMWRCSRAWPDELIRSLRTSSILWSLHYFCSQVARRRIELLGALKRVLPSKWLSTLFLMSMSRLPHAPRAWNLGTYPSPYLSYAPSHQFTN